MARKNKKKPAVKGDIVMFIGGVYDGHYGWYDTSRNETAKMCPVIVYIEEGHEYPTRVRKENVALHTEPTTTTERILREHRDIEKLMRQLCVKLAECDLKDEDVQLEVITNFAQTLRAAVDRNSAGRTRVRRAPSDTPPNNKKTI